MKLFTRHMEKLVLRKESNQFPIPYTHTSLYVYNRSCGIVANYNYMCRYGTQHLKYICTCSPSGARGVKLSSQLTTTTNSTCSLMLILKLHVNRCQCDPFTVSILSSLIPRFQYRRLGKVRPYLIMYEENVNCTQTLYLGQSMYPV